MQSRFYPTTFHRRALLNRNGSHGHLHVVRVRVRVGLVGQIRAGVVGGARSPSLLVVAVGVVVHVVVVVDGSIGAAGHKGLLLAILAAAGLGVALAAACAEQPEQRGGDSESGSEPDSSQEVLVDAAGYTVVLGRRLDGTNHDNSQGSNHGGGGAHGEGGNTTDQVSDAGDGAAAVGEETQDQLKTQSNHGDDVDNLGPLGDGLESGQGVGNLVRESNVVARGAQVAVVEGGRGPVELGLGALAVAIRVG